MAFWPAIVAELVRKKLSLKVSCTSSLSLIFVARCSWLSGERFGRRTDQSYDTPKREAAAVSVGLQTVGHSCHSANWVPATLSAVSETVSFVCGNYFGLKGVCIREVVCESGHCPGNLCMGLLLSSTVCSGAFCHTMEPFQPSQLLPRYVNTSQRWVSGCHDDLAHSYTVDYTAGHMDL